MARVFIVDRWLKNDENGNPPTAAMKRSLANVKDPMKAKVPAEHRSSTYGKYDRWRCRWYAEAQGVKTEKSKTFRLLSDAEEFKAAMEDDIRRGRYHDPKLAQKPFRRVAEEWTATKADIKPGTLRRYKRELRIYINPQWGDTPIGDIKTEAIQKWVNQLSEGGYPADRKRGTENTRALKPRSIRNIVRVVMGGVLGHALKQGYITANPMQSVATPRVVDDDDDMVFLSIPEVEDLAIEAGRVKNDPQDTLIVRWQAYVGPRIGETFALQVKDMDFPRRRARIRRTWAEAKDGKMILGSPKNGKARWVAFPEFLVAGLERQCDGRDPDDYVFRAARGGNLWVNTWRSRIWSPAVRRAGMEDSGVRIHDLRHTYASIAIANGCDVKTLQSQLGHSSAMVTLDTYARLWPEKLDEVADAVGRARAEELDEAA